MRTAFEHIQKSSQTQLIGKNDRQLEDVKRRGYLSSRGIKIGAQHQLDLIFPQTIGDRGDLRHIPNDYARSSLFSARNKNKRRKTLTHEMLFHYNEHISILYTGIELRAQDDEIVWLQILNYGQSVVMGHPFEFQVKKLVLDLGWAKNGRNYDRVRQCISRLKATEVMALNSKAYGKSEVISLIKNYTVLNDADGKPTHYQLMIDPNLILLFAGNTFTSHSWAIYRNLSPVARRLTDYIDSHKNPLPLGLDRFQKMCASSDMNITSWRQTVRRACAEVQRAKIAEIAQLDKEHDQICCVRD